MRTPLLFCLVLLPVTTRCAFVEDGSSDLAGWTQNKNRLGGRQPAWEPMERPLRVMRGRKDGSTDALRRPHRCCGIVRRSCDIATMKCAAIALALQGASGLVAPRLTVKSSALNAATLEASPSDATKVILAKSDRRAPPAGPKTSRQRYTCTRAAPRPALLQKAASHTHPVRPAPPHPWLQKSTTASPRHQIPNNSPTTP